MESIIIKPIDIIAIQSLDGCGLATTRKVCDYIAMHNRRVNSPSEMAKLWAEMVSVRAVKGKLVELTESDFELAYRKAQMILSESEKQKIGVLTIYDEKYPAILKTTVNEKGKVEPPLLLFYRGNLSVLDLPAVAIIGTREPTDEGINMGFYLGKALAEKGFNVVSGLAIGCDTSGHEGALAANGMTTAFLAHGLDMVHPSQNVGLAEAIVKRGGLLMSEYPVGTQVSTYSLVARDRLQAGLSLATIVVQTGVHGGTMHAANATLISGKPLYAVQYKDMSMPQVQGNLILEKAGGRFITPNDVEDVSRLLLAHRPLQVEESIFREQRCLFPENE